MMSSFLLRNFTGGVYELSAKNMLLAQDEEHKIIAAVIR